MAASDLLSDKAIRAALKRAQDEGNARKISDGGGLVLDVRPTGAGWWRLRYWRDGREGMLSLGTYPAVSLADARGRRDEVRKQLAAGVDPSTLRKDQKRARAARQAVEKAISKGEAVAGTFEAVAREWLATVHQAKVSEGHAERHQYTRPTGSPVGLFFSAPAWLRGFPRVLADLANGVTAL